ncbi:Asialoglycoprotein receptor 1 [Bagarius yarrelli]|uniref:Asialoglycoprotein receptor 1 n=1 Tax=Bagarius yarrelli TaxID=175774 RepID=A0A556U520_BAGYA|nr:Asialoglycoprotein receptor 1 [Bagarius yarrelli]
MPIMGNPENQVTYSELEPQDDLTSDVHPLYSKINRVSDKHDILSLNSSVISSQLAKLQSDQRSLTESRNALQTKHDEDVKRIKSLQVDLNRETRLKNELNSQKQKLEEDKRKLQSQISNLEENCGKCLPNWVLMNSTCLYFAVSPATPHKGWNGGRDDCKKKGADLVVIDSKEKQVTSPSTEDCFKFQFQN